MAWEVIFSARSRNDLEQIVKYIARDDPVAAERFGLKLVAQAESLVDAPEMGPTFGDWYRHPIIQYPSAFFRSFAVGRASLRTVIAGAPESLIWLASATLNSMSFVYSAGTSASA
jgi:plasmid stabilization system protein ParE